MGIGNLQRALPLYGARDIPYAQLYFDSTPLNHAAAWRLLYGLGDDSSTYLWRVLAAERLMKLYRTDRRRAGPVDRRHALPSCGGHAASARGGPRPALPGEGDACSRALRRVAETIGTDVAKIARTSPLTIRAASGRTFYISRRYRSPRRRRRSSSLDRLSALSLIDWGRRFDVVAVQVR